MNPAILKLAATTTFAALGTLAAIAPASAVQFGQQEVDQSRFITMAAPVGSTSHQLVILEQLNSSRSCWQDNGETVEPLLLNFDFTGICNRSTDSNGYSIRVGGQDLGLDYSLRLVPRDGQLVLIAASTRNRNAPTIDIGKAPAINGSFTKITLNPGWKLTKRVYNGQTLGHVYLTNDQDFNTLVASASSNPDPQVTPAPQPIAPQPTIPQPVVVAPQPSPQPIIPPVATRPSPTPPTSLPTPPQWSSSRPNTPSTPDQSLPPVVVPVTPIPQPSSAPVYPSPAPTPSQTASQLGFSYRVIVPAETTTAQDQVRRAVPGAFRTTLDGRTVMQVGLFRQRSDAETFQRSLTQQNLQASIVPIAPSPVTPPPQSTIYGYRVFVPAATVTAQDQVRRAAPGAFRTTIGGQQGIQVAVFTQRSDAETLQRSLSSQNLQASIIPVTQPIPQPSPHVPNERIVAVIDPGHGGRDPGAIGIGGLREKDVVFSISQQVAALLEREGIQAILTRQDDRTLDLAPRVSFAERTNADLFVSIHANALNMSRPDVNGVETYYHATGQGLASSIQNSITQSLDVVDRGVRQARFYVIRETSMPSALVEVGFVTGRDDAAQLRTTEYQSRMAGAIARGIVEYVKKT